MSLAPGSRLGPYEIVAPIGAGGMGEVYKARDTRLDRIVAIKVSKEQFSERFEREARAVAALNHSHICTLHDVGPNYLVMEFVEGTQLKSPLPLEKALEYAGKILDALDAAHQKGIVHRDLKPENILVTRQGIKLLDFGLARMDPGPEGLTLTHQGEAMGTPAYMSPEQWEGKPADACSDIYSFGCLLYEMLTGKRAAQGWSDVEVRPVALGKVLRRCLEKDPEERWQSARDVKAALALAADDKPTSSRSFWRERAAWIATVVVVAGVALFLAVRPSPEKTVFSESGNVTVDIPHFALSPDGRAIAFVASAPGASPTIWVRSLNEEVAHALPGTEGAQYPFWSPDGHGVAFFSGGKLKKTPETGGGVQVLAEGLSDGRGGTWGPDGTILFTNPTGSIYRVSSGGGPATAVTRPDPAGHEAAHRWPQFLPDGRHFLFVVVGSTEQRGVYVASLDGKIKKFILHSNANAVYASPGYLLFLDGDTLMAQSFDAGRMELNGQPLAIAQGVGRSTGSNEAVSASSNATLAYSSALVRAGRLTWFDRSGDRVDSVGTEGDYTDFRLSPSEKLLAASLVDPKTGLPDIRLTDLARGGTSPFAFGQAIYNAPLWSPDGTRILFRTNVNGLVEFYQRSAAGGGTQDLVLSMEQQHAAGISTFTIDTDWSPDGKNVVFSGTSTVSGYHLWLLPVGGDRKPVKLLGSTSDEIHANFSPDGRLLAYSSNESKKYEVYVQTLPLSDKKWPVSTNGGYEPRWRADGREIYYLSEDRKLMAVSVGEGPSFGVPKPLFQTQVPAGVSPLRTHYVPSRDGRRFLINTQIGDPAPTPITIVLNWTAGLKK
jgi:Tol biopolymer transport system component/predicted Ser/Thr protein kinase